jgi:hypothetical protein
MEIRIQVIIDNDERTRRDRSSPATRWRPTSRCGSRGAQFWLDKVEGTLI